MTGRDDGGAAFPKADVLDEERRELHKKQDGMSLRDYFAAKALLGFTSNFGCNNWDSEKTAEAAYRYADAMLKKRGK